MFDDDTRLIQGEETLAHLHDTVQGNLRSGNRGIESNELTLSITKTNLMCFQDGSWQRAFPVIEVAVVDSQNVQEVNFLGVIADEHVNWKSLIKSVCIKV